MPDRLSALDASFLYMEQPTTPMHVGGAAVFKRPSSGFDYDRLVGLIERRIALVPRYRQKVRAVPGHLARPVWVDDQDFDVTYHVRRSALPRPGAESALWELVARLMSRPLDQSRPLWEMYLVDGLARGRFAVITKTHHAVVDGISAIDIGQVLLDASPTPRQTPEERWLPRPEPGPLELVLAAVGEAVARPGEIVDNARAVVADLTGAASRVTGAVGGLLSAARTAVRPAPGTPLNVPISIHRRFAVARTSLDDYRAVRKLHGGTVNDVVLAVVAGALRNWLLSRGEAVRASTTMRAMVPLSVRGEPTAASAHARAATVGNRVSAFLVDLPVGEPNPVVRLHQVSHAMATHKESGQSVGADALVRLGGFAPPTLHALGVRAANGLSRRLFNLVVSNVPGPQFPLYADGAKMLEMFPMVPLASRQSLAIGLTSYDGGVYFGCNADRDAMPDLDVLAGLVAESLEELLGRVHP